MAAPLTQTQLPQESILDINGKQTYLGNSFVLPQNGKSLSDTMEHPLILVSNPAGSGKSLFMFQRKLSTDNNTTLIRFYANAVVNVAGSTTAPVNLRSGSATTSVANCYLGATITSAGTLMAVIPSTIYSIDSSLLFILDPGNNFYISGQQISGSSGSSNVFIELTWYEI